MLTRRGCEIENPPAALEVRLQRELRVTPVVSSMAVAAPRPFEVYLRTPKRYIVPQHWAREALGNELQETRQPGEEALALEFAGTLRPDQRELVDKALALPAGCVLCAKTGQGKTAMALHVASVHKKKTVVLVHKTFLAEQWMERARQFVPKAKVSMYGSGTLDFGGDIVVAMIQTVLSRGIPQTEKENVGFVVVDEVHRLAAPSFCKVLLAGLNAPRMLGLSATPERPDKLERVIHWLCGPLVRLESDPSQIAPSAVRIVFAHHRKTLQLPLNRRGDVDHSRLLTMLGEDDERTAFLVGAVVSHVPKDQDCLILSHRRAHCQLLAACLKQQGYEAMTYLGGDKEVPKAKVLVSTYNLVAEGFDEPRLSALVFATPAASIVQAVGRIMRRPGPKLVLDVIDTNPVCYGLATKRKAAYRQLGFLHSEYMFRTSP